MDYSKLEAAQRKQMNECYKFARIMSGECSGSVPCQPYEPEVIPAARYVVKGGRLVKTDDL